MINFLEYQSKFIVSFFPKVVAKPEENKQSEPAQASTIAPAKSDSNGHPKPSYGSVSLDVSSDSDNDSDDNQDEICPPRWCCRRR